jgi:DNA adenine methylase
VRYLGGKFRTATEITGYLNHIRKPGQPYWEPFVGGGWILSKIRGSGVHHASDVNHYLIRMWKALQDGWDPPRRVSEEEYKRIAADPDSVSPELAAFVGFGCSWGGKWFGGFARNKRRTDAAEEARRSLLGKMRDISTLDVGFFQNNFLMGHIPPKEGTLIYCDPPYENMTGYGGIPDFDSERFWNYAGFLGEYGHTVVVSEYECPHEAFSEVMTIPTRTDLKDADSRLIPRTERLFRYGDHTPLQPALW